MTVEFVEPKIISKPYNIENEDCSFAYYSKNPVLRRVFLQRLKEAAAFMPENIENAKILDLGTGCGYMLPTLSKISKNGKVIAFDCNESYLKKAKILAKDNKLAVSYAKGNLLRLKFPDNYFDLINAISVLEHIQDLDKAVQEIRRVIKSDGLLIVGIPIERFLVNTLFSLLSLKDYILGGFENKKYRKNKYQDVHYSDIKSIESTLSKYFVIKKSKKIFSNWIPDSLSLYKIYLCFPK